MIYEYDDQGNPKMREYELVVVGVMKTDYSKRGTEGIIMNIADMKRLEEEYKKLSKNTGMGGGSVVMYGGSSGTKVKGYDQVYVKVDDVNHVGAVEQMIKDIGYQTSSMTQYREDMQKQVASGQMMLGGLAAVSLLVAALNIANTMTMAIYERTKEIGVMKVLGCKLSKIRQMFLIESGTIGFIGGVIGCLFSVLISFVLNNFTVWMQAITGWLMSIGVQVNFDASSFDVGALFGMGGMGGIGNISDIPAWLLLMALILRRWWDCFPALLRPIGPSKSLRWKPSGTNSRLYPKNGQRKDTSCCRIKTTTGGVVVSRQYAKAEELNGEVFRKKAAGETNREKAESYGLQTIVSFYTFSICETYLPNPEYTQFYNFKRIELETASRPTQSGAGPQNSSLFCDEALYSLHCALFDISIRPWG